MKTKYGGKYVKLSSMKQWGTEKGGITNSYAICWN